MKKMLQPHLIAEAEDKEAHGLQRWWHLALGSLAVIYFFNVASGSNSTIKQR
jgi:hypothetical protein